ncbi:MAG: division/cell wall cluster transcriptional repressor MraZ [Armatimonadota bacterium]|nr:division/cell wall cluster transcriptional repressor MraZ [Armatimonadota bacterium]
MLFGGISEHTLDPNGRVIIPRKLRFSLGETFVITRGLGKCLRIFTMDAFNGIKAEADKIGTPLSALFDPEILRIRRQLFGEMIETTTDGQWRVLIPPRLREYAEITNAVVLVGAGDWIEVWNPDNWRAYTEQELTEEKLIAAGGGLLTGERSMEPNDGADIPQTGSPE